MFRTEQICLFGVLYKDSTSSVSSLLSSLSEEDQDGLKILTLLMPYMA